jgi:predicted alpha-1,2-mannosidase
MCAAACGSTGSSGTDADPGVDGTIGDVADVATPEVPGDLLPDVPDDVTTDPGQDIPGDPGPGLDDPPYARWINPFIGSGGELANVGSALPGATAPFGLVKVSPDTKTSAGVTAFQHCGGYHYEDDYIYAFTHNHLHGTGAPDYGNIGFMPVGEMTADKTPRHGLQATFTHEGEVASAGYYAVNLTDPRVRVELTASTRCAHHRYTFLDGTTGTIALDPTTAAVKGRSKGGAVSIDATNRTVDGWNHNDGEFSGRYGGFPVYFTIKFDRPFASYGTWLDGALQEGVATVATSTVPNPNYGAYFRFDTATDPVVEFQVCLSYVDAEGAQKNMAAEMPTMDFEAERAATVALWEAELGRMEVQGGSTDEKVQFYTSIYHVMQMPTIWSDVDGRFRTFDRDNPVPHQATGWTYYTDMSFWDTFRTSHPLYTLVWPERQRDMMRSLTTMMNTGGWSPMWPMGAGDTGSMIGQHSASVAADTVLKGMVDFNTDDMPTNAMDVLYDTLKKNADGPTSGSGAYGNRGCLQSYLDVGYCAADASGESVSLTLEYAFNDYCLAEMAKTLGKTEDEARYRARSTGWKKLWDADTGFFRAHTADGTLTAGPFEPTEWNLGRGHYVEGTAWQWMWFVPHDEAGLRETIGGDAKVVERLSIFMEQAIENFEFLIPSNYFFMGNEPDIHAPFLAIRAGRPDLTQRWSRWILDANWANKPDGMVGNDDAGTLAAWYAFAAVGLYPWPCFPGYYITAPIFDRAVLHLPKGDLIVEAAGATGRRDTVISEATFNGVAVDSMWLKHSDVENGGTLRLTLTPIAPNAAP